MRPLWFTRRREAAEEIRAHLAERIDDLVNEGVTPEEARAQAHREFGNPVLLAEQSREAWGWLWLDRLAQDLRYAMRTMRRSPAMTAVAVLSLGLGVGANTVLFTLMESALWRPIPAHRPEQLRLLSWHGGEPMPPSVTIWGEGVTPWGDDRPTTDGQVRHTAFTWPQYQALRRGNTVLDNLFSFHELGRATAVVDGNAEPVKCFLVSPGFYDGMGVVPRFGQPQGTGIVISDEYWLRRFHRDPAAIGKTIVLNQSPVTIVGVNPAWFTGVEPGANFDIWAPLEFFPAHASQTAFWISMMGRAKAGVSDGQAQSALDLVFQRQVQADFPGVKSTWHPGLRVEPGARGADHLTNRYGMPLAVLLVLAGLVLLIACTNVANLLLARSAAREREMRLRMALGAGRLRIARQLLTEGLMLAMMAGVAGVAAGYFARNGIPALMATSWQPSPFEAAFDTKVLAMSMAAAFGTGILFSLAPAWRAGRTDALKPRGGGLLVVAQIALSLILLAGTGLFVRTFVNLKDVRMGFSPGRVLLFALQPPRARYTRDGAAAVYEKLRRKEEAMPGIASASFSEQPLLAGRMWRARISVAGTPQTEMAIDVLTGPRFFDAMNLPIVHGRPPDERDNAEAPHAAVVNVAFGRRFFHEENPLGRTFTINGGSAPFRIVGVCADAAYESPREPVKPALFRAYAQNPRPNGVTFELKLMGDEAAAVRDVRGALQSIDAGLAITDVRMQADQTEATLTQERLLASLAAAFGGMALILASVGIYGVMAHGVVRRTREIGVRVALGARPGRVSRAILRETLWLALTGVAIGVPAAMWLSQYARSLLYGLAPGDPLTSGCAALGMLLTALAAAYLPARAAGRVDPAIALRHE